MVQTFRDPVRPIDAEWMAYLEVLDQDIRAMPGSFVSRKGGVDPRLTGLKVMFTSTGAVGPREGDEIALYEHVARVRHRTSGQQFVAFRETMDVLMARQTDPEKFPMWVMNHPVKKTELRIYFARVLHKPSGKYDNRWLEFLPETPAGDRIFDTLHFYLSRRGILKEEMYGSQ
jgi:hypothetical protein